MKRISFSTKIIIVTLFIGIFQQSCTKLEEEVYSDLTGDLFFQDPANLKYAIGATYTNLYRTIGHKYGMVGKEAGTDLLVVPQRGGDWYDGGEWHRYHRHEWSTSEAYVKQWWDLCYAGINKCNQLILQFSYVELETAKISIAELRALRALYYYWLVDLYGNVPIIDRFDYPADYKPATIGRDTVYDFIEKQLLGGTQLYNGEVVEPAIDLLSKEIGLPMYGRVNYYTAYMILAKLYLNAEVYIGIPKWDEALAACEIISNAGYSLEPDFFDNFVADATTSPEHILGIPYDQIYAQEFELHLFTLHYSLQNKFGIKSATWNGICAQEAFFNSFEEADLRRNGLLFGPQYDAQGVQIADAGYEKFDPTNPTNPIDPDGAGLNLTPNVNMLEPSCLRQCGARIAKFPFIEGSDRYMSNDFPIFRYADVLLMKAECLLRKGDASGGLVYVNQVRSRAGVAALDILDYESLLLERGRELFAEGHRRSDMIRFSDVINQDNPLNYFAARWEKPNVTPEYRKLWPIPKSQTDANPNLKQNPGY